MNQTEFAMALLKCEKSRRAFQMAHNVYKIRVGKLVKEMEKQNPAFAKKNRIKKEIIIMELLKTVAKKPIGRQKKGEKV